MIARRIAPSPRITATAVASPGRSLPQAEAKAHARELFARLPAVDRLIGVFDRAGVEQRQVVLPVSELVARDTPRQRHEDYVSHSIPLLLEAARAALSRAHVCPDAVTHVVLVSSTGLANPTLDVRIAPTLGLTPSVRRVPLWGLGCGGGAQGIALAADLARSRTDARVLLLLVELCSLTLVPGDLTPGNLVAGALFGDGAAAAVVEAGEAASGKPGIDLLDSEAARIENTLDVMGWNIADDGWRVVFSPELPALVRTHAPRATGALLSRHDLTIGDVARHVLHPGGPAILDAYEQSLGLGRGATAAAREALSRHGNCSSVSIFQTMERALPLTGVGAAQDGEIVLFSAFGPGFSAEVLLGRFARP